MLVLPENEISLKKAVEILKNGGVISFATETVYALACDATNNLAVKKLYEIKKRAHDKPIAVWIKDLKSAKENFIFSNIEEKIATKFMPGAITLIVRKNPKTKISKLLNNASELVGLRIPNHKFSLKLLKEFDGIIAATSANIAREESAVNADEVAKNLGDKIDLIIDGGICKYKIASTVIQIKNNEIEVLREGLIKKEEIKI